MHISIFTHQLFCYFVNYCVISNFMFFFSKKRWRKLSWGEHLFQIHLFDFSVPESLNKTRKIKNWKKKYWIPENVCIANQWNNLTTWQFTLLRLYNNKTNGHNNKHNYFIWCRYLILDKCVGDCTEGCFVLSSQCFAMTVSLTVSQNTYKIG